MRFTVLCLKYLLSLAMIGVGILMWLALKESREKNAAAACTVAAAIFAVYCRGAIRREACLISFGYLSGKNNKESPAPGAVRLLCGESVFLASSAAVMTLLLSPSYICLYGGIRYYRLSSERGHFMLLLAAAMLLAAGGVLFGSAIRFRWCCAEYLWLSGICVGMTDALDSSWELTRGNVGDFLKLRAISFFFGFSVSALCQMNFSEKLLRSTELPMKTELSFEIVSDSRGEQRLELI